MAKAKLIEALDCNGPAQVGIRLVLLTRLEEMCQLRAAALDWSDMEGVHDMRVASRRLRSALLDFRPYLRKQVRQKGLRQMARSLGAVRDEDVAIAALGKLAAEGSEEAEVSEEVSVGLNHIIDERSWKRERARKALERAITEWRVLRLKEKLGFRFVRATRISSDDGTDTGGNRFEGLSFRRAGREIISKRLEELYELGESLYHPYEVEPLHDMRIAAKRLRYAMELFAQCWGESLAPFSEEVARIQDSLGDLHDCDMWIEDLGERLQQRGEGLDEPAGPLRAMHLAAAWLLQHFTKARAKHYRRALARWRQWEEDDFRSRLLETLSEVVEKGPESHSAVVTHL